MIKASDGTEEGGGSCAPLGGSGHVEHTPGPWKAAKGHDGEPDRWCVVAARKKQYLIAVIENGQPGDCCETEGATARLIAAAPELLEALKAVVAIADRKTDEFDRAHAAIQKASGQNDEASNGRR